MLRDRQPIPLYALIRVSHIQMDKFRVLIAVIGICTIFFPAMGGEPCVDCDDCMPRMALKTNLLHDALLTPDIGLEVGIGQQWSLSVEGVWAWWSRESSHRYWRIYGGWVEFRYWFGSRSLQRSLTGHHAGLYGSMLTYDFEFGNKGWQSPDFTYGVGISYGHSWAIGKRLNIDVSARVGYSIGKLIKYHPQCDTYVCIAHYTHRYMGLTGIEVTLVWFPGRGHKNSPEQNRGI